MIAHGGNLDQVAWRRTGNEHGPTIGQLRDAVSASGKPYVRTSVTAALMPSILKPEEDGPLARRHGGSSRVPVFLFGERGADRDAGTVASARRGDQVGPPLKKLDVDVAGDKVVGHEAR